jgi:hypothetical protein
MMLFDHLFWVEVQKTSSADMVIFNPACCSEAVLVKSRSGGLRRGLYRIIQRSWIFTHMHQ